MLRRLCAILALAHFAAAPLAAENTLAPAPTPSISWNAASPGPAPGSGWEPVIDNTGSVLSDITWSNSGGTLNNSPITNLPSITATYQFGAGDFMSTSSGMWASRVAGDVSDADATFEMWFRPSNFPIAGSPQYLHDSGGAGDGMAFYLDGTSLSWTIDNGATQETLSQDLSGFDTSELIQAVLVYDRTGASSSNDDTMAIYINGELQTSLTSTGVLEDFDGGDDAGLADFANALAETTPAGTDFIGEIALFNYYASALSDDEVFAAFRAISPPPPLTPEPGTLALFASMIGIAGVFWRLRRAPS